MGRKKSAKAPALRDNDYLERCSYCFRNFGKTNLKICSHCRMVRYCSRDCQQAAWPTHKPRCKTGTTFRESIAEDDELEQMNSDFTKWLNCWRQTIHTVAIHAYDLPNHPHDRLATHCIFIEVERRPGIASISRSFRMIAGRVLARSEFVDYMRENECSEEDIKDWEDDNRGDHTVHIIIVFHGLMRMLWFTIRDLTKDREGSENSAKLSSAWAEALVDIIDAGTESTDFIRDRRALQD